LAKEKIINEEKEKMFAEVNILRKLDHPNIVRLYELFEDSKNYYLITE
jgi:calcium-dependent protein kinase